ncbi:MAG TPA: glycosyltransferase family 2 protein [Verrucomicrobia bacterium]|nr:glycosyltransferase family 2 protein [Verrucomicrobiota bacterium]HOB31883.1 glycosyltransferase family 2 protein [Verrucomicrobiota bacterium]HOP98822.1 glycosyltransferase family 2 protein [Verrucomicrobiota bacterium]
MNWPLECAAVIPCLNESAAIQAVVNGVRRHLTTVIVVDDGSTDDTGRLAAEAGAEVLRNERPSGKGAALASGWRRARERGFAWVLTLDGDGQHAPEDIPAFFDCVERTSAPLISGNRMSNPAGMPPVRRLVNWWMSRQLSRLAGQSLPDTQCGYRLMRLGEWSRLASTSSHFEIESEILLNFARAGFRIEFVPIQVIYRAERSKIHPLRDTLRWFRWLKTVR